MGNGFVWIVSVFGGTCLFDSGDITLFPRQNFPFGTLKLSQLTQTESSIAILKISHHTTNLTSTYPNMELVIDQQRQTKRKPSRLQFSQLRLLQFCFYIYTNSRHWLGSAEFECDCVYGQELCQKRNALNLQRESEPTLYYIQKGLYLYNVITQLI